MECATGSVRVTCRESNGWITKDDAQKFALALTTRKKALFLRDMEKTL